MRKAKIIVCIGLLAEIAGAADLGTAARGIYEPVAYLTVLMRYASYATGIALVLGSFMQFRTHIENPKVMPLLTPIFMLLIGGCLILLPYFSMVTGNSWSAEEQERTGNTGELQEGRTTTTQGAPVGAAPASHWSDQYLAAPAPATPASASP